jgi:hypothetical protein
MVKYEEREERLKKEGKKYGNNSEQHFKFMLEYLLTLR